MGDEKVFDVNHIYIGCPFYRNGIYWEKETSNHYVAYSFMEKNDEDGNIVEDVLTGEEYHLFDEMKNNGQDLQDDRVLFRMYSLQFAVGDGVKTISETNLKGFLARLDIVEANSVFFRKRTTNSCLVILKECLDNIELLSDVRVKTYYMNRFYKISRDYIDIAMRILRNTYTEEEYNELVKKDGELDKITADILNLRDELGKEEDVANKMSPKRRRKKRS